MPHILSKEDRWAIVWHYHKNLSYRAIADKVGCSKTTVVRILKLYESTGDVVDEMHTRAKRKLNGVVGDYVQKEMVGVVAMGSRKMKAKLQRAMGVKVSHVGITKYLNSLGITPRSRSIECGITRVQKAKRLKWCNFFRYRPKSWWEKVVLVDEKNFGAAWAGNRHNDKVWGYADTVIPPRPVSRYQASIKVGGVLSFKGKTAAPYLTPVPWDGDSYGQMLKDYVFPYTRKNFHGETVVFFQDNDPSHLTAANKKLLRDEGLLFEGDYIFPSNSGDLNPVENFWSIVLENMEGGEHLTDSAAILASVQKAWKKVEASSIRKMLHSMPDRIEACIAAEGARTKW
jgi:transposase